MDLCFMLSVLVNEEMSVFLNLVFLNDLMRLDTSFLDDSVGTAIIFFVASAYCYKTFCMETGSSNVHCFSLNFIIKVNRQPW